MNGNVTLETRYKIAYFAVLKTMLDWFCKQVTPSRATLTQTHWEEATGRLGIESTAETHLSFGRCRMTFASARSEPTWSTPAGLGDSQVITVGMRRASTSALDSITTGTTKTAPGSFAPSAKSTCHK